MYLTIFSAINLMVLAIASPNSFFGELSKFSEDEKDQLPKFEDSKKLLRTENIVESLPVEGLLKMLKNQDPKANSIDADTVNLKLSFLEDKEDKKNCTVEVTKTGSIKSFKCHSTKGQQNDISTVPEKDKPTLAVRSKIFPERRSAFRNNNTNNNILSISYQH